MKFEGFPEAALDFYDDLELDNTKSFWEAHKHVYESAVRDPMLALTASLAEEFGSAKVFRPYRDVRFAKDKTPYKTAQGAFVSVGPATGWYVEIGSPGVRVGGGYYHAGGPDLARIRTAIDTEHSGEELVRIVEGLQSDGFEIRGEQLKTSPRGYSAGPPPDRPAALQVDGARQVLRLREAEHPRARRPRPRRLARAAPPRRLGRRPGRHHRLTVLSVVEEVAQQPSRNHVIKWFRDARWRSLLNHRKSVRYSGFRSVAMVRSISQWAAIETILPSSLTR